jgi:4'-phosphopantetheinyl transferase
MHHSEEWEIPPDQVVLSEDEVHVWRVSVLQPLATIRYLRSLLSRDEIARAERFRFEKDRYRFIVTHGLLRILLARYLNIPFVSASQLQFCSNAYGKPSLDLDMQDHVLNFNLSHSHELILFAFTYVRQVGVDIEYMRPALDFESLAQHSFSPLENEMLRALPTSERVKAFYQCWSRKEAYIKARGKGLAIPLDSFDVSLRSDEPAALLNSREDPHETARWRMCTLHPHPDYASALAVEGDGWHLHCWQLPPIEKRQGNGV